MSPKKSVDVAGLSMETKSRLSLFAANRENNPTVGQEKAGETVKENVEEAPKSAKV